MEMSIELMPCRWAKTKHCGLALLCENCLHYNRCSAGKKDWRGRSHTQNKSCFTCKHAKAGFLKVECTEGN